MSMPNFTADLSLSEKEHNYAGVLGYAGGTGIVLPQFCRCAYIEGELVCWCSPIRAHL